VLGLQVQGAFPRFDAGPSDQGFVITLPNIAGGMHGGDPGATAYPFFRVDDLDQAVERVKELGGSVDEIDIEGDEAQQAQFGRFKMCHDDQGSHFGLHQPPTPM